MHIELYDGREMAVVVVIITKCSENFWLFSQSYNITDDHNNTCDFPIFVLQHHWHITCTPAA